MKPFAAIGLLGTLLFAAAASAQSPYDGVLGTTHNFLGSTLPQEVCLGCHIPPANVDPNQLVADPLWGGGGLGVFLVGSTDTEFPDTSQACLSCHDGVTATAVHQDTGVTTERGGSRVRNHPIQITYPRATNGTFVVSTPLPQNTQFFTVPDIAAGTLVLPTGSLSTYQPLNDPNATEEQLTFRLIRTRNGEVHCESCHNPHSDLTPPYLRALGENLCLVCHDK
ncbi:MAG: cytochrome c3 family protein [Leptospirillia bacterium]